MERIETKKTVPATGGAVGPIMQQEFDDWMDTAALMPNANNG